MSKVAKATKKTSTTADTLDTVDIVDVVIPSFGESISEASVLSVLCKNGDGVKKDEVLLELETDKVTVEVYAPCDGVAEGISVSVGDTVNVGDVAMKIDSSKSGSAGVVGAVASDAGAVAGGVGGAGAGSVGAAGLTGGLASKTKRKILDASQIHASPSAVRLASDLHLEIAEITGTGKGNLVTKEDVENAAKASSGAAAGAGGVVAEAGGVGVVGVVASGAGVGSNAIKTVNANVDVVGGNRDIYGQIERVRMSRLRQTIATRLKDVQNTAAILTTFNEVDMTNLINLRATHKEEFEKKHGVKLGFMSFFSKACAIALQEIPEVNAEIDGEDLIYKNYYNIGVAVGTEKGLIVPVVKNVNLLSLAQIEAAIATYAKKARDGKIEMGDLQGGTFTISNGGVYGSMMSTPILNSPQSGILGLHNIVKRPVVVNDAIEIRSMMYLALSYDHRVVDGKSAVTFLVKVKNMIEDPSRLMLNM